MRPKGGLSSSGTQNMQSSTGQYSTHAGEPAQPVQHSVMTASSLGFFLRGVSMPADLGSNFSSSGTMPGALDSVPVAIRLGNYTLLTRGAMLAKSLLDVVRRKLLAFIEAF